MALIEHRIAHRHFSLRGAVNEIRVRLSVWRTRRALARLTPELLEDIGVSAREAHREVDLSLWDVPANWRQ